MSDRLYEVRDPVHGFICLSEWERDIVNHEMFQRLRRIRQLSWTDMVYPGAMHTRFEHSLGVMHVATRLFNEIRQKRREFLKEEQQFNDDGLGRDRALLRIAALLHDVGHAPFSHAGEELMQSRTANDGKYKHEDYSAAIVRELMRDVIENHPCNQNYGLSADQIAQFIQGDVRIGRSLLWCDLLSGQLDADRADYLLRDSHHAGVAYGVYDLNRLFVTATVGYDTDDNPRVGVEDGGLHAVEGLVIARYMMFTQVYFQHTRRAYDHHFQEAMKCLLAEERRAKGNPADATFPAPTSRENLAAYIAWDDWRVLGLLAGGGGGPHGEILRSRDHDRPVYWTSELPNERDQAFAHAALEELRETNAWLDSARSSWYKFGHEDIPILRSSGGEADRLTPLSTLSSVVAGLKAVHQLRVYVPRQARDKAKVKIGEMQRSTGEAG